MKTKTFHLSSRLLELRLNAFSNSTHFMSSSCSCFHGRVNASAGRDIGSFTSKEQAVLHRDGKHVTHALRMHSRWAISSTDKWVFRPVIIHIVHHQVRSRVRVRFSTEIKGLQKLHYGVIIFKKNSLNLSGLLLVIHFRFLGFLQFQSS